MFDESDPDSIYLTPGQLRQEAIDAECRCPTPPIVLTWEQLYFGEVLVQQGEQVSMSCCSLNILVVPDNEHHAVAANRERITVPGTGSGGDHDNNNNTSTSPTIEELLNIVDTSGCWADGSVASSTTPLHRADSRLDAGYNTSPSSADDESPPAIDGSPGSRRRCSRSPAPTIEQLLDVIAPTSSAADAADPFAGYIDAHAERAGTELSQLIDRLLVQMERNERDEHVGSNEFEELLALLESSQLSAELPRPSMAAGAAEDEEMTTTTTTTGGGGAGVPDGRF